ncbi:glycoside hydrolase family 130 protein [Paenibacillus xylanilyticus]|uniref:glycoside hydrolase family 130 protein n=1 Tax=Paenibacillus xylanilyticus TaxID=248903 RepID=UPI0039A00B9B
MNSLQIGNLVSSSVIRRHPDNPILDASRIPYPTALVFNAGVTKFNGKYVMVFRNDYGCAEQQILEPQHTTDLGIAFSDDGVNWEVQPKPCFKLHDQEIIRAYDPRLTVLGGRCYMCFAVDTQHGIRGGIAVTDDFEHFEILSLSTPDLRNMVLFPEKIGGNYIRLERPFTVYSRGGKDRFDTWISESPDLKYWGNSDLLLAVEDVPFANDKIGPAAPPIKTKQGWLTTFHAVDLDPARGKNGWESSWKKRYTAGLMLLDLDNPKKIIGMSREPLLAPEVPYETHGGFRNNVIFPGGMILEEDGEVKIYYGAADAVECLATAHIDDLIKLCLNE